MELLELIKSAFAYIKNFIVKVIDRVLNFAADVVGWFRELFLDPKKDVPFIADAKFFKEKRENAPVKNVGLFKGVYDEQREVITNLEKVDAKDYDETTRSVMGNNELVVLN